MSNKLDELYAKITYTRSLLHALLDYNSPTDYIVINCSRHLDMLLNKYDQARVEFSNNNKKEAM